MNTELMEALNVLEKEKNIRKEVVLKAIEESLVQACKHHFGKSDNIVVNMDYNTGEYEINMAKEVVENVEDQQTQISLPNAKILDKRAVYGSTVYVKVNSKEFGRIAAQIAKAIILQKLREEENRAVYERYKLMERDLVSGVISRHFERRGEDGKSTTVNVSVNLGKAEATLMAGEQIKGREAGSRTKMAVCSHDENVDAVGACVGVNSSRVNAVVDELGGEKIDIINWDENAAQFIENALSPSKVIFVAVDDDEHSALVVVPDSQLSLAIGKAGQNARLTAKLTGYKIDIKSESQAEEEGLFDEIDFSAAEETEQSDETAQDNEVQE